MAHVIAQPCCNDAACVDACPVNCIHPTPDEPGYTGAEMLYIDPKACIDCGACVEVCPVDAIVPADELTGAAARYSQINAAYFPRPSPSRPQAPVAAPVVMTGARHGSGPLRVAIVGSGPAGFYAAGHLLNQAELPVEVEMFDRLPTPWGLVRAGVAPDHPGTKAVTGLFRWTAAQPGFRFHLGVEIGRDLSHADLMAHHHAVIYAVGAPGDRRLGIPGEDLTGSHAATEFVAWYNGHPDFADRTFDLSGERAVIVGNGNVALDVARILVASPETLAATDIADHALVALARSRIREVIVLGRRGPAQAAYTSPELLALGELAGVDVIVDPAEASLDEHSLDEHSLDTHSRTASDRDAADVAARLKAQIVGEYAARTPAGDRKRIVLRFLTSPVEILGDERVEGVRVVRNELVPGPDGSLGARATDQAELIEAGFMLRSIGYRGTPLPGVPFDERRGTIANEGGRVIDLDTRVPRSGVYTTGWIKRGPSGVIGTNKKCAQDTVRLLLADHAAGFLSRPEHDGHALGRLVGRRQPDAVDRHGWQAIDDRERESGRAQGRPRVKLTRIADMLDAARRS